MTTIDPRKAAASRAMDRMRRRRGRPTPKTMWKPDPPHVEPATAGAEVRDFRKSLGRKGLVKPATTAADLAALQAELDAAKARKARTR